jgi:putative selenium metabolism protein SsnA
VSIVLSGGIVAESLGGEPVRRDLVVDGGRIGGIANGTSVDVSGCLIIPGNACAHHHLYSALARGMPGPRQGPANFLEILERIWWRLDRALDLETIELSGRLGAVAALRAGTTSLIDHHASPSAVDSSLDALSDGIDATGARAVVCYEVTDRHGQAGARAGIHENERFIRSNSRALIRAMVGAHASFTLGDDSLEGVVAAARDSGVGIHIHVAEDDIDERHSVSNYGLRTAHRLNRAGALGEGDLIAHGVHLDDSEIELVRSSGAWIAHNPRSNMNNGVGYAPAAALGTRVGLGTDGIDGDMFAEARGCYLKARENDLLTGPDFAVRRMEAAASAVAASFGEPGLGTLAAGAPADLMVLEYDAPTPLDGANLAGHLLFGLGAWAVRDVMVGGRWVVRARRHLLVDEDELAARCREAAPQLWARMEEL